MERFFSLTTVLVLFFAVVSILPISIAQAQSADCPLNESSVSVSVTPRRDPSVHFYTQRKFVTVGLEPDLPKSQRAHVLIELQLPTATIEWNEWVKEEEKDADGKVIRVIREYCARRSQSLTDEIVEIHTPPQVIIPSDTTWWFQDPYAGPHALYPHSWEVWTVYVGGKRGGIENPGRAVTIYDSNPFDISDIKFAPIKLEPSMCRGVNLNKVGVSSMNAVCDDVHFADPGLREIQMGFGVRGIYRTRVGVYPPRIFFGDSLAAVGGIQLVCLCDWQVGNTRSLLASQHGKDHYFNVFFAQTISVTK